eukprot:m.148482 g.148482  ORF g.148482 m.148482 type:complete len:199 (+) comp14183_c0_seq5:548-1144(+)
MYLVPPFCSVKWAAGQVWSDIVGQVRTRYAGLDNSLSALMLPTQYTEHTLYETIAGLSYTGDVRMGVAEKSGKVQNIVKGNIENFQRLYRPLLPLVGMHIDQASDQLREASQTMLSNPTKNLSKQQQRDLLPAALRFRVDVVEANSNQDQDLRTSLTQAIRDTIKSTSIGQAIKGVLTAGPTKAAIYLKEKVLKALAK